MVVGEAVGEALQDSSEVQDAEQNEHQSHGQLHAEAEAGGNHNLEEDDGDADDEDGERVAKAPHGADKSGLADVPLFADDGGHRDHVIGIGGVAHSEDKAY